MKLVKEHINFERGLDPKDAMNIGVAGLRAAKKYGYSIDNKERVLAAIDKEMAHNSKSFVVSYKSNELDVIRLWVNSDFTDFTTYLSGTVPEDDTWLKQQILTTLNRLLKKYKLNESINFERGLDPRKSMGTGRHGIEAIIKLNPTPVSGAQYSFILDQNEVYRMMSAYPDAQVDIKVGKKHKLFSWNIEDSKSTYADFRQLWRQDADHMWRKIEKMAWNMGAGVIKDSKGQLHPIEINETQHFKRGLEPKDAMGTGDIHYRLHQKVLKAVKDLASEYAIYKVDDLTTATQIYIAFNLQEYRYIVTHSDDDNIGFGNFQALMQKGSSGISVRSVHTIDEAITWIKKWIFDLWQNYKPTNESINFQRGIDPKAAMGTGLEGKYPDWKLFHLIHQESKDSENFNYVTPIDYYKSVSKSETQPSFSIESKFIYSKDNEGEHVTPKMYTMYLTKYGVDLVDNNTDDEKRIYDLKMFNKVTHCFDLDESHNFKRGIEPKEAMGIGNVKQRELEKLLGEAHLWNSCGPNYPQSVIEEVSLLIDTPVEEIYCMHEEDLSKPNSVSKWDDFLSVFWNDRDEDDYGFKSFKKVEWNEPKHHQRVVFNCSKKLKMAYDGSGHPSASSMILFNYTYFETNISIN